MKRIRTGLKEELVIDYQKNENPILWYGNDNKIGVRNGNRNREHHTRSSKDVD